MSGTENKHTKWSDEQKQEFEAITARSTPRGEKLTDKDFDKEGKPVGEWAKILGELEGFLSLRNLASHSAGIRRNADHLIRMMTARGITTKLLESAGGGPPAVYGELRTPGAARTVVFYAHYDGQPVDTTQWATPPWKPVLRDHPLESSGRIIAGPIQPGTVGGEWRLYARSASDDKAPIEAMLVAIDALRAARVSPSVNLKFFEDHWRSILNAQEVDSAISLNRLDGTVLARLPSADAVGRRFADGVQNVGVRVGDGVRLSSPSEHREVIRLVAESDYLAGVDSEPGGVRGKRCGLADAKRADLDQAVTRV